MYLTSLQPISLRYVLILPYDVLGIPRKIWIVFLLVKSPALPKLMSVLVQMRITEFVVTYQFALRIKSQYFNDHNHFSTFQFIALLNLLIYH